MLEVNAKLLTGFLQGFLWPQGNFSRIPRAQAQMLTTGEVSKTRFRYIDGDLEQHHLSPTACSGRGEAFGNALLTYQGPPPVFTVSTMAALVQEEENDSDRLQEW